MVSGCLSEEDGDVPARRTSRSFDGMKIYNETMLPQLSPHVPAYTDHFATGSGVLRNARQHRLHPPLLRQFAVQPYKSSWQPRACLLKIAGRSPARSRKSQ